MTAIENSIAARAAPVDPATGGDLAENAIVWIILAYSDEAEGADKLTKRANGGDLPDEDALPWFIAAYSDQVEASEQLKKRSEDVSQSSDIIALLVGAYSDEVEGADKLDKRAEDLSQSSDIIALLVAAYSDEVEGADKLDKRELARRAVKSKRAMTPKQVGIPNSD